MTVQEMIDKLLKVEDKSREITLYMSSNDPAVPGTTEIFGFAFDVMSDILKDDEDCNDVVINGFADCIQFSRGLVEDTE